MSVLTHVHELKKKHEALSSKIEEALRSPSTDDLYISDLKKQKLRLKEQIQRLSSETNWPHSGPFLFGLPKVCRLHLVKISIYIFTHQG